MRGRHNQRERKRERASERANNEIKRDFEKKRNITSLRQMTEFRNIGGKEKIESERARTRKGKLKKEKIVLN